MKISKIIMSLIGVVAITACSTSTPQVTRVKVYEYDVKGPARYVGVQHISVDSSLIKLAGIDMPSPSQKCIGASGSIYNCGHESMLELQELLEAEVSCIFQVRSPAPQAKLIERDAVCYSDGIDISDHLVTNGLAVATDNLYFESNSFSIKHKLGMHAGRYMSPTEYRAYTTQGLDGNTALIQGKLNSGSRNKMKSCDIPLVDSVKYKLYLLPGDKFYGDVIKRKDITFACTEHEAMRKGYKRQ